MEEFDDNDFSDLYADVEVQASSAITALHRLKETPPEDDRIADKATGGEYEAGGLTKLPVENSYIRERDDCNEQRFDDKCGNSNSSFEFGAVNTREHGGVNGTGKSVEGGDYNSQMKNLLYDCSDSKKMRVDEMDSRVCKNGDTDEDSDSDHYFRRSNEGNRLASGRNGGCKIASERVSEHARAYDPVPISESVEDSHDDVVSECDSEGNSDGKKTSDDTNRRNSSSMSSGVPHDSVSFSSPSPSPSLCDIHKSYKHSKKLSSVLVRVFEEESSHENHHPYKDSRRHHLKPEARTGPAGRYYERRRGSSEHKKSNDMHDGKTHRTGEDASYVSVYGKRRAVLNFDSKEKDMSSFGYSNGFYPNDHAGPAYLKNQYWGIHPSSRYEENWCDGRDMSKRRNILKRNCKSEYKALEDERYHHKRRHVQCNSEQSWKVLPKYPSAVGTRDTRFSNRGNALHFRRKTEGNYDNKFIEGKYGRYVPSGGRCRDQRDHRYDRNIAHDRREIEGSERRKRRCNNYLDSCHNLRYIQTVGNDRRHIEHSPLACSYEKPCGPGRRQSEGYYGPISGVLGRNMRCSWENLDIESGHYGTDTYAMNANMKDHHDEDHVIRERHHEQFKVLHSRVDVYKPKHQDDTTFLSKEPSYHSERILRNNMTDDRRAYGHVTELVDERELDRHRFKMMGGDRSNQFGECHKFIQKTRSCVQMNQRYQDSVDPRLVIEGKKITSEAGNDKYYGRHDIRNFNNIQKRNDFEVLDDFKAEITFLRNDKADAKISNQKCHDTFSVNQKNEFLDIEEGQIITEENDEDCPVNCGIASETATSKDNGSVIEGLGEDKIREIIEKMEKRRERFKEPIALSKDFEKISDQLLDSDVETAENGKSERPARKRRWF